MANMLFANNCNTTLSGSLTNVATTMSVTSATGFPSPTGSQYFYCTLTDAATQTTIEIVKVTAVSGTTFTIVRGLDGTTGTAFSAGAVVSLRLVRANLTDFALLDEANTFTFAPTFNTALAVGSGGTGLTSLTSGYIPYGNGTSAFQSSSAFTFNGSLLTVQSAINVNNSNFSSITFTGTSVNTTGVYTGLDSGGGYVVNVRDAGYIGLSTNNTERARIFASGGVSIGNTTDPGATNLSVSGVGLFGSTSGYFVASRLQATQSTTNNAAATFATTYSGDVGLSAVYVGKYDNNSTVSQVFVKFLINNATAASGQINANGASQAAFGAWSDARLKKNIVSLPSQLNNILALRPVEFDYKDGSGRQIGFIAQEMQSIYPDVVGENSDGMLTISGWNKTEARLVKAIQEQQALIESLTVRLTKLEGK